MHRFFACLMTIAVLVCSVDVMPVFAGKTTIERDKSTVGDEISTQVWYNGMDDVVGQGGEIIFPDSSTENTSLIAKIAAIKDENIDLVASVRGNLTFTSLPVGKQFVLVFGLKTLESTLGEPGNVEIAFFNEGGLRVTITAYDKDGNKSELLKGAKAGSSLSGVAVQADVSNSSELTLTIGGNTIYKGAIPNDGSGRLGFLQTGSCGVKISDIHVTTYKYDRPENANVFEDFEGESIDTSVLFSKMLNLGSPYGGNPECGIVEDENGNHVFKFKATMCSYLGTQHEYSNFEMAFDVPYLQRQTETDDEGNVIEYGSGQLIVAWGGDAVVYEGYGYETSNESLLFRTPDQIIQRVGGEYVVATGTVPFWTTTEDRGFSVKIRMKDDLVTVWLKWIEDSEWIEVWNYELPTVTGTIHIWGLGYPNFTIDNLSIVNLDENPKVVETEYETYVVDSPGDFEYTEEVMSYVNGGSSNKGYYMAMVVIAGACAVAIGAQIAIKKIYNKKRKGGEQDE